MASFMGMILGIFLAFLVAVIVDLVLAFPVMFAWDASMPAIFKLPEITYWQAFSLLIVTSLLLKSGSTSNSCK